MRNSCSGEDAERDQRSRRPAARAGSSTGTRAAGAAAARARSAALDGDRRVAATPLGGERAVGRGRSPSSADARRSSVGVERQDHAARRPPRRRPGCRRTDRRRSAVDARRRSTRARLGLGSSARRSGRAPAAAAVSPGRTDAAGRVVGAAELLGRRVEQAGRQQRQRLGPRQLAAPPAADPCRTRPRSTARRHRAARRARAPRRAGRGRPTPASACRPAPTARPPSSRT